jgi:HEAT repeat protein
VITDPSDLEDLNGLDDLSSEQLPEFGEALKELADPAAGHQPGLLMALSDPRAEDVRTFAEAWPSIDPVRRRWIAERLLETAEASFQVDYDRLFTWLLDDEDAAVRGAALDGLWEDDDPRLVPRFLAMLKFDPDEAVRAKAATALGEFVYRGELDTLDGEVTEQLITALTDTARDEGEDILVRRRATEAVGYADRPDVHALIESHFDALEQPLRAGAVCAMGRSVDERWSELVQSILEDADPEMRYEAALAAGKIGLAEAIPKLFELADTDEREIQLASIWSLGEIGGSRARRALDRLAQSAPDDDYAEAVDDALGMVALSEGDLPWGMFED